MKNSVKRNSLILTLLICMFVALIGFSFTKVTQRAKAEEGAWQTGLFEMEDGVSLKLSNSNGIRFIVKMDKDVRDFVVNNDSVELGFIIAPEQLMVEANGNYLGMSKKVQIPVNKNTIYQEGEFYLANGCLTNIKYENFTYKFVAIAYVKQGDAVRYTEYNSYARNSLYSTVNSTFLSVEDAGGGVAAQRAALAADGPLYPAQGDTQQQEGGEVGNHEGAAAVLGCQAGEAQEITEPDGAAGHSQYYAQVGVPVFCFLVGTHGRL